MLLRHPARPLAALVLGALLLGAAGCSAGSTALTGAAGNGPGPHGSAREGTVVLAAGAAPASLDFTTTSGAAIPQALMGNVYETLVTIDSAGEIRPGLASSWEVSPDGTVYIFHLRPGVRFSNGDAFTAHTARFSLDRVRGGAWTNGLKAQMDPVADTRALDDLTLEVRLHRRSASWLWNMGTLVGAMMTPSGVDDLAAHPVGTGPYEVEAWAVGSALRLRARPDYWGPAPANRAAEIRYFPDAVSAANALESGDVDVLWALQSPELLDPLRARGRWNIDVGTTNGEVLFSMNNRREPFDRVEVRQAVLHAVDRQAVIDTVWEGYGVDTGGAPVPPTDPWYRPSGRYPFDPDRARDLLRRAGFATDGSDPRLDVTITVPSLPYAQATSELVYTQLRDVGFRVTLQSAEFPAVWLAQVLKGHDYDASLIAHVEPRDVPTLFGNPDYYLGFDSPRTRELLDAADGAAPEDNAALMEEAVDSLMAEAAADTLMNLPNIVVSRPEIGGIEPTAAVDSLPLARMTKERG
ncbi:ABC transporter substrate-binding protein [Corynebacterium mastitidis]|uniref:Peptide ABC transporter substrate-binding protein n=1 Tax=Corynebacterium mastitidis TaxID=161890 RepID=A0A2N0X8A8_9CORY|nr:ABC transporter substrate-binding protein [Corynebacterium mastitidis]MCH6196816.1 ABC transporter substrate-binding protein [Corynebacterium mastitidis]PKF68942.1 peptide ABC transporter substrate-binding protein [Corynebacterium mastitidis]